MLRTALGWCCAVAFLLAFAGTPPVAFGQDIPAKVRELMRKAADKEPEDGFCATTDWPPSDGGGNDDFKNKAVVGMRTWDLFDRGATCGSALVTQVYSENRRKCVRYQW